MNSSNGSLLAAQLLPPNFLFGAATSAYQVEGACDKDGRGHSIWDRFLHRLGPHSGDTGDIACDHYRRYRSDVELMRRLGLDAYRFSIAWPRVMPTGKDTVNHKGLDFYDRLVDALLEAGITPFPTLYHWDLPAQLQDEFGGWLGRETLGYFAQYVTAVVKRLGDRVKQWTTFNEPEVIVAGYAYDGMAPGLSRPDLAFHTGHHLMVAHGLGAQAIRATQPDAQVGIVLNFNIIDPNDGSAAAAQQARLRYVRAYRWYLDGLLAGAYPQEVMGDLRRAPALPSACWRKTARNWVKAGDMELISGRLDFLGINYYTRFVVDGKGANINEPGHTRTQMGWQVYPLGLTRLLDDLKRSFKLPPVYVTENGAAFDDNLFGGRVTDDERTKFLSDHLQALGTAIGTGDIDVRGYFLWSLLDNLEWPLGFAKTFGIVHVDRTKNLRRVVKDSGRFYSRLIAEHKKRR